jgi:hypothetical protein
MMVWKSLVSSSPLTGILPEASQVVRYIQPSNASVLKRQNIADLPETRNAAINPFASHCADSALIWDHCLKRADSFNKSLAKVLNNELDTFLIFVSDTKLIGPSVIYLP